MKVPQRVRALIAAVLAVLAGAGASAAIVLSVDDGHGGRQDFTVKVPVKVPAAAQTTPQGDLNGATPLKDETPPGIDAKKKAEIDARSKEIGKVQLVAPREPAGAQIWSCKQRYGGHLYSTRRVKPTEFVVHYTAGPGTAASTVSYFQRTKGASSTFVLEPAGPCLQMMPVLSAAPWTQLAANQTSISVEIVSTGYNVSRAQWLAMPIFRQGILAAMMRDNMRLAGIPLRFVDPVGCNFVAGWTDHLHLECGNDHTDVGPNFPYDVLQAQLVDSAKVPAKPSAAAVVQCKQLNRYRSRRARGEHIGNGALHRQARLKRNLDRHHYKCGRKAGRTVIVRKS